MSPTLFNSLPFTSLGFICVFLGVALLVLESCILPYRPTLSKVCKHGGLGILSIGTLCLIASLFQPIN
jgi:hypothetical protein